MTNLSRRAILFGASISQLFNLPFARAQAVTLQGSGTESISQKIDSSLDGDRFLNAFRHFTAEQILDVTRYGGAVDVTAALQTALDAAYASNRDLFIPAGLYIVTDLVLPGSSRGRTKSFRVHGQGSGELFARGLTGGTIIKQSRPSTHLLLLDQNLANAGNGNQEIAYIRFEGHCSGAVIDCETLYGQSAIHHCGVYNSGAGDGIRIRHANTIEVHNNYVLNDHWGTPGTRRTGIGIHVTLTNDNGLLTLRKNTCRGFKWGFKIGDSESGYSYSARLDQCEGSVVENGIWLTRASRSVLVQNCYLEGGDGGTGILNEGHSNSLRDNHIFPGFGIGIDDNLDTNYGSVIDGNLVALGNAKTAARNPIGIRVKSSGTGKVVRANTIVVDHVSSGAVVNAKGLQISGTNPILDVGANVFEPSSNSNWISASGSEQFDDVSTGAKVIAGKPMAGIARPAGGVTIDGEARAAINAIRLALEQHGLIAR